MYLLFYIQILSNITSEIFIPKIFMFFRVMMLSFASKKLNLFCKRTRSVSPFNKIKFMIVMLDWLNDIKDSS